VADAVVDASVWVSRFVAHDVHHTASARWLASAIAAGHLLVAPALMLAELAGPIARRTGRARLAREAVGHVVRIATLRLVTLDRALATQASDLAADLQLRGADAVYVAVAVQLGLPLVTFDQEQRARGSRVVALVDL
jgi:predicted nucleic acid-binding protein